MPWGLDFNQMLALAGILLLGSVLASKASAKLGIPALVLFIVLGMLAGSDGPGGLHFEDYKFAQLLGQVALALIIFSGGLDTQWDSVKPIIWRAVSLSTFGVAISCGLVAWFCVQFLGFSWVEGLLLGAVVSSTDAAAVFSVLRARAINLRRRLIPTLETESGSNDPMAVFLTVAFIQLIQRPESSPWSMAGMFVLEMAVGLVFGWVMGRMARWLMAHIRLEYDGLYPAITIAVVLLTFGGSHLLLGNGYLAVYVLGLTLGKENFLHRLSLIQFHDGLAWLMQIAMFLTLGLLSYPTKLGEIAGAGLLLAFFLMLVARPVSVYASLAFFRMRRRERLFIAWGGLRGAVPIILAIFPLTFRSAQVGGDVPFGLLCGHGLRSRAEHDVAGSGEAVGRGRAARQRCLATQSRLRFDRGRSCRRFTCRWSDGGEPRLANDRFARLAKEAGEGICAAREHDPASWRPDHDRHAKAGWGRASKGV